ncbi:MAG: ferrous iron transport protein A [Oscillospiraceae bacterium]|nr:ferrous iron transport protein A [Oscillospiraceae bacterium]
MGDFVLEIPLSCLGVGKSAVVKSLSVHGALRRRLSDIGVVEGAAVKCVGRSPLGDPAAYMICGAVIAIRDCDSRGVSVEPL